MLADWFSWLVPPGTGHTTISKVQYRGEFVLADEDGFDLPSKLTCTISLSIACPSHVRAGTDHRLPSLLGRFESPQRLVSVSSWCEAPGRLSCNFGDCKVFLTTVSWKFINCEFKDQPTMQTGPGCTDTQSP